MLHSLDASGWSPAIAVLTNLTENHLDWHGTFEHYRHSKETIFRHQRPGDVALRGVEPSTGGSRGDPLPLSIPGAHNQSNARLALAAAAAATGHDPVSLAPALVHFRGLPHRLQLVMSHGERRFYDDSKATTPAATALAVDAFDEPRSVHLIVGGADKDIDLDPLIVQTRRVAGVYTIGATGPSIAERGRRLGTVYECETLETAVRRALKRMGDRDTLLLSPGCASWDQFTNYEQRGTAFERLVRRHTEAAGSSGSASSSPTTDQSCDP